MNSINLINAILARHDYDGTRLMQILRETQDALGWLAPATLTAIAKGVNWPRAKVEGTAAFYSFFHTRPRGKFCVLWSDNITDRMLGNFMAPGAALDLYHGSLRARRSDGSTLCDFIPTPLADKERQEFLAFPGAAGATLGYHWARMIEMLHAAEAIKDLLHDDDIVGTELMATGQRQERGVGVIEAIRVVARQYLDGRELTEGLLNHIEVAIRCFAPCLSCATHAPARCRSRLN